MLIYIAKIIFEKRQNATVFFELSVFIYRGYLLNFI